MSLEEITSIVLFVESTGKTTFYKQKGQANFAVFNEKTNEQLLF